MPRRRKRASKRLRKVIKEEKKALRAARPMGRNGKPLIGPVRAVLPRSVGIQGGSARALAKEPQVAAMVTAAVNLERWYEQKEYFDGQTRGMTLYGQMPIGYLRNNGTGTSPSGAFVLPNALTTGLIGIALNPTFLLSSLSPEYRIASTYSRFQFSKVRLHFTTQAGANITGSSWSSYLGDVALGSQMVNVDQISLLAGATQIPIWCAHAVTDFTPYLSTKDWFYTTTNSGTDLSLARQCDQGGLFFAWQNSPSINFGSGGYILNQTVMTVFMEYSMNLIDQMVSVNQIVPPGPVIGPFYTSKSVRRDVSDRDVKEEFVARPEPEKAQAQEPSARELAVEALRGLDDSAFDELYSRLKLERKLSAAKSGHP